MTAELRKYFQELGIDDVLLAKNRLPLHEHASLADLEVVDIDFAGRPFLITRATGKAWRAMVLAAAKESVTLNPASGFRSYLYQKKLIEARLAKGQAIADILTSNAIPGYSEHHTGRAIDICADPGVLEERFHETPAFAWLTTNAAKFGFKMSYPKDNAVGMIYEPWHWCYHPDPR